jgi:ABC-type molybdate transport system substrate-binding protein
VDIRTLKVVIATLTGLAAIIGIWEPIKAETLTVGAPTSLRAAFNEILPIFEQEYRAAVNIVYTPSNCFFDKLKRGLRSMCSCRRELKRWSLCTRRD